MEPIRDWRTNEHGQRDDDYEDGGGGGGDSESWVAVRMGENSNFVDLGLAAAQHGTVLRRILFINRSFKYN